MFTSHYAIIRHARDDAASSTAVLQSVIPFRPYHLGKAWESPIWNLYEQSLEEEKTVTHLLVTVVLQDVLLISIANPPTFTSVRVTGKKELRRRRVGWVMC